MVDGVRGLRGAVALCRVVKAVRAAIVPVTIQRPRRQVASVKDRCFTGSAVKYCLVEVCPNDSLRFNIIEPTALSS